MENTGSVDARFSVPMRQQLEKVTDALNDLRLKLEPEVSQLHQILQELRNESTAN